MNKIETIAIIGAGNMGAALAKGLAQGRLVDTARIRVANPSPAKLEALKADCPEILTFQDNLQAVETADMVVLAVKPWKVAEVLAQLKPCLNYDTQLVASMVGGLSTARLDEQLAREDGKLPAVASVIPNTAIAVGQSMTFFTTVRTDQSTIDCLSAILGELGKAVWVEERLMGAGLALASCGTAFAMRYIRAAMEGGVELGLRPEEALQAVLQTVKGSAMLLEANGEHPEAAIDRVTTAGGITIRGLNAMEKAGFTASVIEGLKAAKS